MVLAEQVLNGLLLARQLILENFDFGLQLDGVLLHLVVEHLHLDGFVVELLLFLGVESVVGGLRLGGSG